MLKKNIIIFIFIFFSIYKNYAQKIDSKKHINKIHKLYENELNLNTIQSKKFKNILLKYNPIIKKLIDIKSNDIEINKQTKLESLEIYDIINREQFSKYKKIKQSIEEYKKYRK